MNQLRVIENGLLPVYQSENQERVVNARELHEFLEVGDRFDQWIQRRIEKYGFTEGRDFCTILCENQIGRPRTEYLLKMDVAKEIAMVENNEKGRDIRKYFIEVEDRYKASSLDVSALSPQVQALINLELRQKQLELQQAQLHNTLTLVKDTLIQRDDDWRNWVKETVNRIAQATGGNYQLTRAESYEELEVRARCKLGIRLTNLKDRLKLRGS